MHTLIFFYRNGDGDDHGCLTRRLCYVCSRFVALSKRMMLTDIHWEYLPVISFLSSLLSSVLSLLSSLPFSFPFTFCFSLLSFFPFLSPILLLFPPLNFFFPVPHLRVETADVTPVLSLGFQNWISWPASALWLLPFGIPQGLFKPSINNCSKWYVDVPKPCWTCRGECSSVWLCAFEGEGRRYWSNFSFSPLNNS